MVLSRSALMPSQHSDLSMHIRNHRLGICDCHAGVDRELGLKGAGRYVNAKQDKQNAR